MAHPTRFERVTFAFRASLVTPPQPLQGRCRRTANRLNEPHAPVAQLDRALPSEGKGHTFESCRVRHESRDIYGFGLSPVSIVSPGLFPPHANEVVFSRQLRSR